MSKGGGGGSQSTQTQTIQKSDPWAGQQPYLKTLMEQADKLYSQQPLQYYPGQTYAPFSPETQQALGSQTQRAQAGSPLVGAAQSEVQKRLEGDYLSAGNPYFEQMAGRVRGQVQPAIDARFAASGRSGSGLANRALGMGLGDAIGGLAYQNYGDERQRQSQAAALAPTLANQDYFDIAKLAEVGAQRENLSQQGINEDVARFDFEQMEPWQRLGLFQQAVQGGYGGTTSTSGTQQLPRNSLGASMLGGGLGGAGTGALIGSAFGGPGIGSLVGGGLGLLAGLF